MTRRCGLASLAALAAFIAAGCEEHPRNLVHGTPEYLHEAMTGDVSAQAHLAECLDSAAGCLDTPRDPAFGCAWRAVRLDSRSPALSLADATAYAAACSGKDETFRQRAAIAQDSLMLRVYARRATGVLPPAPTEGLLYPSIEAVRQNINQALGMSSPARLPEFGRPILNSQSGHLEWRTCSRTLCLEGSSPAFGGGVFQYRVSATGTDGPNVAAKLAASGIDAQGATPQLTGLSSGVGGSLTSGPICWTVGRAGGGEAFVAATLGAC